MGAFCLRNASWKYSLSYFTIVPIKLARKGAWGSPGCSQNRQQSSDFRFPKNISVGYKVEVVNYTLYLHLSWERSVNSWRCNGNCSFLHICFIILIHHEIGQEFKKYNPVCLKPPNPTQSTSSACPVLPCAAFELHDQFLPIFRDCVTISKLRHLSKLYRNRNLKFALRIHPHFVLKTGGQGRKIIPSFVLSLSSSPGRGCYELLLWVRNLGWNSL